MKSLLKKSLSVVLAVLMVMSFWALSASAESVTNIKTLDGGVSQARTVADSPNVYSSYGYTDKAEPMENHVVPGLSSADYYTPQGMTYYAAKDWILISAYSGNSSTANSVVYALDFQSGEFVAQFNLCKADGSALTDHVPGIACSANNLYVSVSDYDIAYIPLSSLDVSKGTVRNVIVSECVNVGIAMPCAHFGDGCLWVCNFYHGTSDTEIYNVPANDDYNTIIKGYKLEGYSNSADEWNAFCSMVSTPTYTIDLPNKSITKVQSVAVSDGKLYVGTSYGRTSDSKLYVSDIDLSTAGEKVLDYSSCTQYDYLPMMEGMFIKDGYMYNVFESAAYTYNGAGKLSANPSDVLWKFNVSDDEAGSQSGSSFTNFFSNISNKIMSFFRYIVRWFQNLFK